MGSPSPDTLSQTRLICFIFIPLFLGCDSGCTLTPPWASAMGLHQKIQNISPLPWGGGVCGVPLCQQTWPFIQRSMSYILKCSLILGKSLDTQKCTFSFSRTKCLKSKESLPQNSSQVSLKGLCSHPTPGTLTLTPFLLAHLKCPWKIPAVPELVGPIAMVWTNIHLPLNYHSQANKWELRATKTGARKKEEGRVPCVSLHLPMSSSW